VSNADRRVIALGNLAGELKASLEAAVRAVGLELLLTREPARAFVELERDGALAVLVDMATLGAEQFCKRARGTERLRSVPVIGMSRHPNELGFARVFAWGADDLVPLGARMPLERRLQVLRDTPPADATGFGQAVVAEATTQRRALVGRVLSHAGYDVKFAVDRGAVELYASQAETRLVVISAALGDPRRLIENAARAGALPTWIVTVEARSTQRLAAQLTGLDRVAVTSTAGAPEDVLFLANELVFSKGPRRREWRALYATPVAFRPKGGDADEYGFSYDASPSGLYVRSLLPSATEDVEVELRLPNRDERVRLQGKVARRFAFGSGAIASAPPGFSVKLSGPEGELARWTKACAELIQAASSTESMQPPKPRTASQPVLAVPELGGKEMQLAVPATVSIESVVAPLPVAVQTAVNEGSDVGELLAATLDEQTLTEVGTRPVTIDPDTLGVREERPSEFALDPATALADSPPASLPAPLEPTISLPPVPVPEKAAVPRPGVDGKTPLGTVIMGPGAAAAPVTPEPFTPHAEDWESDAKTAVRASQPNLEAPVPPKAASPAPPVATELADEREPGPAQTEALPSPPRGPEPSPRAPEPSPRVPEAGGNTVAFAPTEPPPPDPDAEPHTKRLAEREPAKAPVVTSSSDKTLPLATPGNDKTLPLAAPSSDKTLPLSAAKSSPKVDPISKTLQSASPPPSPPIAKKKTSSRPPPPQKTSLRGVLLFIVAAIAATAVGMGLALVTHQGADTPAPHAASPAPAAPPLTTPTAASTQAAAAPSTLAAAAATERATPAAVAEPAASGQTADAASAGSASSAPNAPNDVAAPATTASTAAAVGAVPPVTPPTFDVNKLPRDRAALVVHSTATAHVFVHGVDFGETNQTLMTTCGIRFVRLGRSAGDFVSAGGSYVIKCGKLNELTIEPTP